MPGLSNLNDKEFIRAFQVTDAVIQNNQPIFIFHLYFSINLMVYKILINNVEKTN